MSQVEQETLHIQRDLVGPLVVLGEFSSIKGLSPFVSSIGGMKGVDPMIDENLLSV